MTSPIVKICCIASVQEARVAVAAAAGALGLVSAMPSGPGVIEEALIGEIAAWMPPSCTPSWRRSERKSERKSEGQQQALHARGVLDHRASSIAVTT
jgi:phosphoribosylanthranilate isomerase